MGPPFKRRKVGKIDKVEEVSFDPAAREEFLTGFRKRKQQRIKHAQEIAIKRAKEEKRQDRQKLREERAAEFKRAMEEHKLQLKRLKEEDTSDNGDSDAEEESDDEWEGIEEPPAVDYEAEYIDEDKYTTVTVEEIDNSREGLRKSILGEDLEELEKAKAKAEEGAKKKAEEEALAAKKRKATTDKPKKKKKQFRYESKQDRKLAAAKQRLSKSKKAKARREK
ncbi:protein required for cell viability Rrp17 [Penicillium brasilianum]|uniref:Protein required for cell viability Rrp17 n=1 Tax=Penicillium brasilianum TaxID=104259 RepID=A0A1S9RZJ7_PENBI|nr:protein required for cell viability Rrp17 [Penicillium brasilianum]